MKRIWSDGKTRTLTFPDSSQFLVQTGYYGRHKLIDAFTSNGIAYISESGNGDVTLNASGLSLTLTTSDSISLAIWGLKDDLDSVAVS